MRVILLTGKLMEKKVKKIASKYGYDVFVAPVDVALFAKPEMVNLEKKYDLLILPGEMKNADEFEKATGIKTVLGTKNIEDLDLLLSNLKKIEKKLSKQKPACELIRDELKRGTEIILRKVEEKEYIEKKVDYRKNIFIGNIPVGVDFPIRVIAEIVNVDKLSSDQILNRARYFKENGADIIDLGFSEENPEKVEETINLLRTHNFAPLSIDTKEPENIECAINSGIDLILSFDGELLRKFKNVEIPSVVIPSHSDLPEDIEARVGMLCRNIELAKKRNFRFIIADPILNPINMGFVDSILAYKKIYERHAIPTMMGVGNVVELIDADSIGVNAVLCGIASECGVCLVLTPEHSDKAKGSVRELSLASKMMFLSRVRRSPPKDLGMDLLVVKEKRIKKLDVEIKGKVIKAEKKDGYIPDKKGFFKIFVKDDKIICVHYSKSTTPIIIEGKEAKEICDTIVRLGLVSNIEHAMYIGRELSKAEFALRYGKSYIQD